MVNGEPNWTSGGPRAAPESSNLPIVRLLAYPRRGVESRIARAITTVGDSTEAWLKGPDVPEHPSVGEERSRHTTCLRLERGLSLAISRFQFQAERSATGRSG